MRDRVEPKFLFFEGLHLTFACCVSYYLVHTGSGQRVGNLLAKCVESLVAQSDNRNNGYDRIFFTTKCSLDVFCPIPPLTKEWQLLPADFPNRIFLGELK